MAELNEVDVKTAHKHKQECPQLRQEIDDRSLLSENAKNMRTDQDAAEQQPYHCWQACRVQPSQRQRGCNRQFPLCYERSG